MFKINYLIIIYLICTTIIISISKNNPKNRYLCLGINSLILLLEFFPFVSSIELSWLRFFYDWSPLLIVLPILHRETELLTSAFGRATYDDLFIRLEHQYFPAVMNVHHYDRANFKLLSEYLHLCYLSFYALIYGVPLFFYIKQDMIMFYETVFVILLLFFSCFITHSFIPVCGPRNLFKKISDHRSHGFFFKVVHKILAEGSTHGTAFPSGHTGIACVIMLMTWYIYTPLFYCILPFCIGIIISTIYGRFHYVLDLIFGFLYALIAFFIAIWLYQ